VRCIARFSEAVEPGTVWTWNAIGKAPGAWQLAADANESRRGFLLNHLITDTLPPGDAMQRTPVSNSDPVTGQAAWFDVRVRIYPAEADADRTVPQVAAMPVLPGSVGALEAVRRSVQAFFAGRPAGEEEGV
jgi:hypothetical protein